MQRREFLRDLGVVSGTAILAASPWLSVFSEQKHTLGEKCRIGIIGPGSRGRLHMEFLKRNPKAEIVALCDIYQPSLDLALQMVPTARTYTDYHALLEASDIDAVFVTTPLDTHFQIVMDAFDAGKDVFCEKTMAYSMEQCHQIYLRHKETGRILFIGQQRLFDPRYIQAMSLVHNGTFGEINAVHSYWNRNSDWRRPVPDNSKEQLINWRLYKAHSKGLMTELACHQLQVGTWALGRLPVKVMGTGAITHWKDGREVYDNIHTIYMFENGVQMTYSSVISNKFYGKEEQILGTLGTVEPERGKYYFEQIDPAPAFLQMINDWENSLFNTLPFANTSWAPETANVNHGEYILGKQPAGDGTSQLDDAFVEAAITHKQPERIAEEGYYASILALWGHDAIEQGQPLDFPEEYRIEC